MNIRERWEAFGPMTMCAYPHVSGWEGMGKCLRLDLIVDRAGRIPHRIPGKLHAVMGALSDPVALSVNFNI